METSSPSHESPAKAAEPEWAHAYLLLSRVQDNAPGGDDHRMPGIDAYVTTVNEDGFTSGSYGYCERRLDRAPRPPLAAETALFPWPTAGGGATEAVIPLSDFRFGALVALASDHRRTAWQQLVSLAFEREVSTFRLRQDIASILYVEPMEPLVPPVTARDEYVAAIKRFQGVIGEGATAAVPQRFEDLLVAHGIFATGFGNELTIVRCLPIGHEETDGPLLPQSLVRLLCAMSLTRRLEAEGVDLSKHTLVAHPPSRYLEGIIDRPGRSMWRAKSMRDTELVSIYRQHLNVRLAGVGVLDSIKALLAAAETPAAAFAANRALKDDDWVWQSTLISAHPYRYGLVSKLRRGLGPVNTNGAPRR